MSLKKIHLVLRLTQVACLLFFAVAAAPSAQAQAECKPVFDANEKMMSTPHRSYVTTTAQFAGGKPKTSESIFVGGVTYIQLRGAWQKSPMSADEIRRQEQENLKNAKNLSCKFLRDDTVEGQPTRGLPVTLGNRGREGRHQDMDFKIDRLAVEAGGGRRRRRQDAHEYPI